VSPNFIGSVIAVAHQAQADELRRLAGLMCGQPIYFDKTETDAAD